MPSPTMNINTNLPSRTITAATLAMMFATLMVEGVMQVGIELRPSFSAALVTFVGAAVGYFTPDPLYNPGRDQ